MLVITDHAYDRMKERCGWNKKTCDRMVSKVFDGGTKHREIKGRYKRYVDGLYLSHKEANNIRIYAEKVFLFRNNILITVLDLPNNFK